MLYPDRKFKRPYVFTDDNKHQNYKDFLKLKKKFNKGYIDPSMDYFRRSHMHFIDNPHIVEQINLSHNSLVGVMIIPPIGPLTVRDTIKLRSKGGITVLTKYIKNMDIASVFYDMLTPQFNLTWSEQPFFRFISVNEFLEHGTTETYGEFVTNNLEKLKTQYSTFDIPFYANTPLIINNYSDNGILKQRANKEQQLTKIIEKFNKEILMYLLIDNQKLQSLGHDFQKSYFEKSISVAVSNYVNRDKLMSKEEFENKIFEVFVRATEKYDVVGIGKISLVQHYVNVMQNVVDNTFYNTRFGIDTFVSQNILNNLYEKCAEISPLELLAFVKLLDTPKFIFSKNTTNKDALDAIDTILSTLDDPLRFVGFWFDILANGHNGKMPTAKNLVQAITENPDFLEMGSIGLNIIVTSKIANNNYNALHTREWITSFSHISQHKK